MKIYTRAGDDGSTGLLGPGRVSKHAPRVEAYGAVDELNASLGAVRALDAAKWLDAELSAIQSRLFNRMRLNPKLYHAREDAEETLTKLPAGIGSKIERLGPILKESLKAYWAPGLFFEELDLAYVGVIDGHDVKALRKAIGEALEADRPVVVHCKTVKGKGFAPAEEGGLEGMEKWLAAKPSSVVNGAAAQKKKPAGTSKAAPVAPPQYTTVFGEALVEEARRDQRVVGITAAMGLWPAVVRGNPVRGWLLGLAIALLVPALVAPRVLGPAHRAWMLLGDALGWVNTRLVLGAVFFGLITPLAVVFRLTGRDPMRRAFDPTAATYRVPRAPRPGTHMTRQF